VISANHFFDDGLNWSGFIFVSAQGKMTIRKIDFIIIMILMKTRKRGGRT